MTKSIPSSRIRDQHTLTEEDIDDLGITHGHVSAWIKANPGKGRNLARAIVFVNRGEVPKSSRLAEWLDSATVDAGCSAIDLAEEIAATEPIEDPVSVPSSDRQDWADMNARIQVERAKKAALDAARGE